MELFAYALVFIVLLFATIQAISSEDAPKHTTQRRRRKQQRLANKRQPENAVTRRRPQPSPANKKQPENTVTHQKPQALAVNKKPFDNTYINVKKGAVGEQIIKVEVLSKLDRSQYHYFHNLIIPHNGATTQIDNIIVSPFGVFVIEAKYYEGWIFGGKQQKTWWHTKSRYEKYPFTNPLHQNYAHIKALEQLIRQPENRFHSIVVFTHRDCQLRTELPANVCLTKQFIPYVQQFTKTIIVPEQIQRICKILSQSEWEATPERLAQHIQSLNQHP